MSEVETTKEEFKQELFQFWERIGDAQENIDFTKDENEILEEAAFYVKKAAILLDQESQKRSDPVVVCPNCYQRLDPNNICPQCGGKFEGSPLDKNPENIV